MARYSPYGLRIGVNPQCGVERAGQRNKNDEEQSKRQISECRSGRANWSEIVCRKYVSSTCNKEDDKGPHQKLRETKKARKNTAMSPMILATLARFCPNKAWVM